MDKVYTSTASPNDTPTIAVDDSRVRRPAEVLFIALLASFIFCVASNMGFSSTLRRAGISSPSTSVLLASGLVWLLGHGLHGAGVVALPLFILTRLPLCQGTK